MTTSQPTLYGIPNCDAVKRARAWLTAHGVAHAFHDFKKAGLSAAVFDRWAQALDWATLINRQGTTWRKLAPEQQATVASVASARALAVQQPSVVKRPVVEWPGGAVTVGYQAMVDHLA